MAYFWFKALHIVFVVSWFAGLFYLPRLFVYHATTDDRPGHDRFVVMERRLFVMMTIGAAGTLATGLPLALAWWRPFPTWLHAKLGLVAILLAYHWQCWRYVRAFATGGNRHGHRYYRVFNEVPTLVLLAVVWLVVFRPG
jgi:putative membrane protein